MNWVLILVLSESSQVQNGAASSSFSDNRTDLIGVPVVWHKPVSDPPSCWDSWIGQFNLAITLRERCDPREMLRPPGVVLDDPVSKSEAIGLVKLRLQLPTELQEMKQLFEESMKLWRAKGERPWNRTWCFVSWGRSMHQIKIFLFSGSQKQETFSLKLSTRRFKCYHIQRVLW